MNWNAALGRLRKFPPGNRLCAQSIAAMDNGIHFESAPPDMRVVANKRKRSA